MVGKLKPLDVERETRPGRYSDGGGLYLIVVSATAKSWSYRYSKSGKQRWCGLGSFKDVSLRDARLARDAARLRVKGDRSTPGVDIVQERRAARDAAKAEEARAYLPTFEEYADAYVTEHWAGWSRKHRVEWRSTLQTYAYPVIGKLTIAEIRPSHIHDLLAPIWIEKPVTASRLRGRIETVIARNVDINDLDFRNPAELTKQLKEKLPKRPKRAVRHHPALPYAEAAQFMTALSGAGGTAAAMLRFVIFTACRTNEAIEACWSEIDRPGSIWKIPGSRMKMGRDHLVPLSDPVLAILDQMRDGSQGELIFPNPAGDVFSENAMLAVLDRLGYGNITVHGFRSTFATWAEETTDYPDGVREAALAHKYKSETTAAYQRGSKLEKRRKLMQDWADYITDAKIIPMRNVS
jgi:integrase